MPSLVSKLSLMFTLAIGVLFGAAEQIPTGSAQATDPNYILTGGDTILISIQGEPELSTTQLIDKSGNCRLSLVGELSLVGKTVADAEREIERTYVKKEMLKAPSVRISIVEYSLRTVTVWGAVKSPGKVPFSRDTNAIDISDVITMAGGFTNLARGDIVTVQRTLSDGKETTFTVDVDSMMSGKRGEKPKEFLVFPGDKIRVSERKF